MTDDAPHPKRIPVTAETGAANDDKQRRYAESRRVWRAQWVEAPTPVRTWLSRRAEPRATVHDPRQSRLL